MARWRHRLILTLSLVAWFAPLGTSGTVDAKVRVIGSTTHIVSIHPGDTYDGAITLMNPGDEPASARIYQTDYRFVAEGRTWYGEPGTQSRSNAPWIELDQTVVTVPPGERIRVAYRLRVPDTDDLHGTYWSIIMVEPTRQDGVRSLGEQRAEEPTLGLQVQTRYAVQVVSHVGGTGRPEPSFRSPLFEWDAEANLYRFRVDVHNEGDRWFRPEGWLELYDASGERVARAEAHRTRIYPGTSVRHRFDLEGLGAGTYQLFLVFDGGGEDVFGVRYTVNVEAPVGG